MATFTSNAFEEMLRRCLCEHEDGYIFFHSPYRYKLFVQRYSKMLEATAQASHDTDDDERIYLFDEDNRMLVACVSEVSINDGFVHYANYNSPFESTIEFMRTASVMEDDETAEVDWNQPKAQVSDRLQVLFE